MRISDWSSDVCSSDLQLNRRFIANVGLTPKEYRARLRLARAHGMIRHTGKSMTQIAVECAYSDGAHLSRWFKAHVGMAPSQARRAARKDRKSVGWGKSVSVRGDLGGRHNNNKKT